MTITVPTDHSELPYGQADMMGINVSHCYQSVLSKEANQASANPASILNEMQGAYSFLFILREPAYKSLLNKMTTSPEIPAG